MNRPAVVRFVIAALLLAAAPLSAQFAAGAGPWRLSYFPYFTASPNDGAMLMARVIRFQQASTTDRITLQRYQAIEGGYSTRKAWLVSGTWAEPRIAEGWRVMGHGEIGREPHFGHPDSSVVRDRALVWIDVTRQLQGPLNFAIRGGLRNEKFNDDGYTDASLRFAVVADFRDREFETRRGALLELGMILGNGSTRGYQAGYGHARGWVDPLPPLQLTGRFAWRQAVDRRTVVNTHEFPGWEGDFVTLGGPRSHRGLGAGELGGYGVMLVGSEARLDIFTVEEIAAVSLLVFADGGKLLNSGDDLTIADGSAIRDPHDWEWGVGAGLAVRVLRSAVLTFTAARHEGETSIYVMSGYAW